MDLHGNAALSCSGRRELARRVVDQGWTLRAAAAAAGVSVRCGRKWVERYRAGDHRIGMVGSAGWDSSRPSATNAHWSTLPLVLSGL
jgi:transposase